MTYINDALSFYSELRSRFMKLLTEEEILDEQVVINTKSLTPEEAIGITKRKDFPIITGKDVMVQAECLGALGQAFTDAPSAYRGTLEEICSLDLANDPSSAKRGIVYRRFPVMVFSSTRSLLLPISKVSGFPLFLPFLIIRSSICSRFTNSLR